MTVTICFKCSKVTLKLKYNLKKLMPSHRLYSCYSKFDSKLIYSKIKLDRVKWIIQTVQFYYDVRL